MKNQELKVKKINNNLCNKHITATLVHKSDKFKFLYNFFGEKLFKIGKCPFYDWLNNICKGNTGEEWNIYILSNGGFYIAPNDEKFPSSSDLLSADATGIVVTLVNLQTMARGLGKSKGHFAKLYKLLRRFAAQHAEREMIFAIC